MNDFAADPEPQAADSHVAFPRKVPVLDSVVAQLFRASSYSLNSETADFRLRRTIPITIFVDGEYEGIGEVAANLKDRTIEILANSGYKLEMGEVSRFPSIKQAISYCGLCGDEKSSADKVIPTPLSKQRNKHIQRVLVEAAKLAPRENHELALVYETEKQKGNAKRATLAVARKMVAYLLAVDRGKMLQPRFNT